MGAFTSTALVIEEQERLFHDAIHKRWSFVFLDVSPCDKTTYLLPLRHLNNFEIGNSCSFKVVQKQWQVVFFRHQ